MNKFSTWSDEKINEEITRLEYNCGGWGVSPCGKFLFLSGEGHYEYFTQPIHHYCNNPAAMWPLIVENKIWVQPDMVGDGKWHCYDCEDTATASNEKPLRAAAEVYLMMKESLK